jgi:hypothetical protein
MSSGQDRKGGTRPYSQPEIVKLGHARELTGGDEDGIVSDGGMKPKGYKDVPSTGPTPTTTPPASPSPSPRR